MPQGVTWGRLLCRLSTSLTMGINLHVVLPQGRRENQVTSLGPFLPWDFRRTLTSEE